MSQVAQKKCFNFPELKDKLTKKELFFMGAVLLLTITTQAIGANGLPFYDKLEFGIKIVKVIGGVIALIAFVAAIYMHRQGRSESLMTAVWFCMAGILTANVEWLAEQFGFLQGVLIA